MLGVLMPGNLFGREQRLDGRNAALGRRITQQHERSNNGTQAGNAR
jgi:hypothetical protein